MTTTKTTCPYCGVGCGVLATTEADGSVSIKGDPDHPANFGRLCSKGSALGETLSLDDRLLYPEVNGEQAGWDDALDLVAEKFSAAIRDHGPDSVAFYVSGQILTEDYYVANKLMKGYIGAANIDTNSRLCMASSVAGHRKAFGTDTVPGTYEDLEKADLIVLVGSNLAWCHPVIYQRIQAAKEARPEMKVVLVDPRKTMTANVADLHLALKADGDGPLFNGLLAHLSKADALDHDYINHYTEGFEAALESASVLSSDELSEATGLSRDVLQEFYELFTQTEKVVTVYSQGVNQSACGTDKVSAIINCHLATGRIGKPGMGPFSITGQPNAMGGREVGGLANMLAAHMNIEDESHRDLVQTFWNAPTMADKHGLKAVDMFQAVADGRIKALWIMATNPVDSMPDAGGVEEAIKNCPFVVVSDVLSETDTVRHAHVKLPATAWGEKDGTVTNSERRISRQKAFLPAPGETRADWWQMAEVAKRMGFEEAFDYRDNAAVFREFAALSAYENDNARDFNIGALADINTSDYADLAPFQWPYKVGEEKKETRFFAEGDFYTPSRKGRFISVKPTPRQSTSEAWPFVLNTGRVRDHWHTMTRTAKTPRLSAHLGEPYVELHPQDALALGIRDADVAEVTSPRGTLLARALITSSQQAGSVFAPMHWTDQYASKGRVDVLVEPLTDPFSGQPALKNVGVKVEKFAAQHFGFLVSREKPENLSMDYWALARCEGGFRTELAVVDEISDAEDFFKTVLPSVEGGDILTFFDETKGQSRLACFDEKGLVAALYLGKTPVGVARTEMSEMLVTPIESLADRLNVLAGRNGGDRPDKGAIVCSCFSVGTNEICSAVLAGDNSVSAIGTSLQAGTNCGSCKGEIAALIERMLVEAAE